MSLASFWGAVVEQAAIDVLRPEIALPDLAEQSDSYAWIMSDSRAPASYLWACEASGISPDIARRAIRVRDYGWTEAEE